MVLMCTEVNEWIRDLLQALYTGKIDPHTKKKENN